MKHFLNLGLRFAVASLFIWSLAFLGKTEGADYVVNKILNCTQNEFNCTSGEVIPSHWACDTYPDCVDASDEDEEMCKSCYQPCVFQCNDGSCIRLQWRCDGFDDCGDNSDESTCPAGTALSFP